MPAQTNANASLFSPYDIIALMPTTEAAFSYATLTHTLPSPLTAHIISIPLTLPRLPFRMKHTMVRTALRNGAVFEINYTGALGVEDIAGSSGGGGASAKRNWWAAATEVVRVTKGKGIILSSGALGEAELRAPKDVGNLCVHPFSLLFFSLTGAGIRTTFLGLAQNLAHDASSTTPKSLVLRARESHSRLWAFVADLDKRDS